MDRSSLPPACLDPTVAQDHCSVQLALSNHSSETKATPCKDPNQTTEASSGGRPGPMQEGMTPRKVPSPNSSDA